MNYTLSDKIIAYLTLFSGLVISAVAVWYSVAGLVSIFAANAISIIIMGVALEGSKLVATVWLKWNWSRAPRMIKIYLISAIAILMLITSMGIFGYLSKAHLDQNLVSGEVLSKISLIDEKIKTERDNIEASRRALAQMDAQVDQVLGRTDDARGAERAVQIRRNQARERTALQNDIAKAQANIVKLNEEAAPIRAEVREVEAKVGPIKYIAALIYGDNPDANILEKAVTWVIIIIVLVFDPLAVVLLLASQYSFQWFRQQKLESAEGDNPAGFEPVADSKSPTVTRTEPTVTIPKVETKEAVDPHPVGWMYPKHADIQTYKVEDVNEEEPITEIEQVLAEVEADDDEDHLNEPDHIKAAKAAWKLDHPDDSLKHQRRLLEQGFISALPWDLPPYTLTAVEDEAAVEAAKWAQEQIENSKKKVTTWLEKEGPTQIKKSLEE
jgi:hypothetical protein